MRKHRLATRLILTGLVTLPMLAACGLRGGLARPEPIFKEAPAAPVPAETTSQVTVPTPTPIPESVIVRDRVNEFGGEIPDAAPTREIGSAPLTDPLETNTEDE